MTVTNLLRPVHAALAALALVALGGCTSTQTPAVRASTVHVFDAQLSGHRFPTETGSAAAGRATLTVDEPAGTVALELRVHGIALDGLWKQLVAKPIGPMHLHLYLPDGNVDLIMPFPYGPAYVATTDGFEVRLAGQRYEDAAKLVGSARTLGEFVAALRGSHAYLNLHTEAFNDGEISGHVVERAAHGTAR